MPLITLTTDFGTKEGYPAAMKGVIYTLLPDARIVDITHDIQPQNLYEAAFVLEINAFFFPPETVHIVVVDPGVGTARRAAAGRVGDQFFVGPDNGVLTRVLLHAERENLPYEFVQAENPAYWRSQVSSTFHGRDIFAPLGAHLARGIALDALGPPLRDLVRLPMQMPQRGDNCVTGEVIHIDHFGNAITNLRAADLAGLGDIRVSAAGKTIRGLSATFSGQPAGTLLALWDSSGYLMISEYGGLQQIKLKVGDEVSVMG